MSQRRLTAALVGALLVCLLGGGLGAYFLGQHQASVNASVVTPPPRHTVTKTTVTYVTEGQDAPPTDSGPAEPDMSTEAPMSTGSEPNPGVEPSGNGDRTVRLAGSAGDDSQAGEIRDLLQRHFDAINTGDYKLWASTVTKDQVSAIPADRWRKEYSTTIDTAISVFEIDQQPRRVHLTFQSRQRPEFAPDKKSTCVNWSVALPLTTVGGEVLIGRSIEDVAQHDPCGAN